MRRGPLAVERAQQHGHQEISQNSHKQRNERNQDRHQHSVGVIVQHGVAVVAIVVVVAAAAAVLLLLLRHIIVLLLKEKHLRLDALHIGVVPWMVHVWFLRSSASKPADCVRFFFLSAPPQ